MQYQTAMALAFNNINAARIGQAWKEGKGAAGAIINGITNNVGTFKRQGWTSSLSPATFKKLQQEGIPVSENNAKKV